MKKTPGWMRTVVVKIAVLTLFAASATAGERPGFETYVVRSGDTLSKISGRIFGDINRWREILKENPQVTNANRIFPGDILLVPVPETAAGGTDRGLEARSGEDVSAAPVAVPDTAGDQGAGDAAAPDAAAEGGSESGATEQAQPRLEEARPAAVVSPTLYRSAGHIAEKLPSLAIVASAADRMLLGTGDDAIVNAPLLPGSRFTVVRAERRIRHPATGAYLGWLIRILGSAEVSCRGERTSTVILSAMNDSATIGDYLIPIDPDDVLEKNILADTERVACLPAGARDGMIVAFNENRRTGGEYEYAYIDRGTSSGVAPGQLFTIYREIAPEGRIAVGEIQVLRAGARTSTALITSVVQEVQIGNLLRAH